MIRIKEVAKSKGLTLTDLAEKLGVSQPALSITINGNPTVATLQKWADILDIPITDLFEQPKNNVFNCPKCGTKLIVSEDK